MGAEELFDVVDDDDTVVGQATRQECHSQHLLHRSVIFFLLDERGRVFVNRRSQQKDFFPGYWSIAFGGHVHTGESYDDALRRELLEETGLEEQATLVGTLKKRIPEERENLAVYTVQTKQTPDLDADEIDEGAFLPLDALQDKLSREPFLPETQPLYDILVSQFSA